MKIVIFGGTTEGRELSGLLSAAGASVTVCVATEYGEKEQESVPGVVIRTGPLNAAEKQALLHDAALCVDATHPYARHVSESVKAACEAAEVEYIRLLRPACDIEDALVFDSAPEAAAYASRGTPGTPCAGKKPKPLRCPGTPGRICTVSWKN